MLGIHWPEFMLIAVVTLLVVGPKELPRVLRTATQMMRKIRGLSREFQNTMQDLAKEADLEDMKKDFNEVESRIADMRVEDELDKTLDGDNKIAGMFTGDVIGTELAQDAVEKKSESSGDFDEQTEDENDQKIESNKELVSEDVGTDASDIKNSKGGDDTVADLDEGETKASPSEQIGEKTSSPTPAQV